MDLQQATTMSHYVEARYALLTLQAARETSQDRATSMLRGLLKDVRPSPNDDQYRSDALAAIESLVLILNEQRMPNFTYWEAANKAAHAWRDFAGE